MNYKKILLIIGTLIVVIGLLYFFRQNRTPQQKFWDWFKQHQDFYYSYSNKDYSEENKEKLDELRKQLQLIGSNLSYELLPIEEDGRRGLAITPNHDSSLFMTADFLVARAPRLSKWHIYAFKQRKTPIDIYYGDIYMGADNVFFTYTTDTEFNLKLYIDGYVPSEKSTLAYEYLLDNVIGEYDAEDKIWIVDVKPLSEAPKNEKLLPILHLRTIIDEAGPCGAIPVENCSE